MKLLALTCPDEPQEPPVESARPAYVPFVLPRLSDPLPVLKAARDLIATGWCQDVWALGADGKPTDDLRVATHFDTEAALLRAADFPISAYRYPGKVEMEAEVGPLLAFNDASTHEEVLAAFDRVIHQLEQPHGAQSPAVVGQDVHHPRRAARRTGS